jgi:hypothetical protein
VQACGQRNDPQANGQEAYAKGYHFELHIRIHRRRPDRRENPFIVVHELCRDGFTPGGVSLLEARNIGYRAWRPARRCGEFTESPIPESRQSGHRRRHTTPGERQYSNNAGQRESMIPAASLAPSKMCAAHHPNAAHQSIAAGWDPPELSSPDPRR